MDRYRRYPRRPAYTPSVNQGVQYINRYIPSADPNIMMQTLGRRQQEFNVGKQLPERLIARLNEAKIAPGDRPKFGQYYDSEIESIKDMVENEYMGDWGAAKEEILSRVNRLQAPLSTAEQDFALLQPKINALWKAGAEGKGSYGGEDLLNIPNRGIMKLDENGNIRRRSINDNVQFFDINAGKDRAYKDVARAINRRSNSTDLTAAEKNLLGQNVGITEQGVLTGMSDKQVKEYLTQGEYGKAIAQNAIDTNHDFKLYAAQKLGITPNEVANDPRAIDMFADIVAGQTSLQSRMKRSIMDGGSGDGSTDDAIGVASLAFSLGNVDKKIKENWKGIDINTVNENSGLPLVYNTKKQLVKNLQSDLKNKYFNKDIVQKYSDRDISEEDVNRAFETYTKYKLNDNFLDRVYELESGKSIDDVDRSFFKRNGLTAEELSNLKEVGIKTTDDLKNMADAYLGALDHFSMEKKGRPYKEYLESGNSRLSKLRASEEFAYDNLLQNNFQDLLETEDEELLNVKLSGTEPDQMEITSEFIDDYLRGKLKGADKNKLDNIEDLDEYKNIIMWDPDGAKIVLYKNDYTNPDKPKFVLNVRNIPEGTARRLAIRRQEPELYIDSQYGKYKENKPSYAEARQETGDIRKAIKKAGISASDIDDRFPNTQKILPYKGGYILVVEDENEFKQIADKNTNNTLFFSDYTSAIDGLFLLNTNTAKTDEIYREVPDILQSHSKRLNQIRNSLGQSTKEY